MEFAVTSYPSSRAAEVYLDPDDYSLTSEKTDRSSASKVSRQLPPGVDYPNPTEEQSAFLAFSVNDNRSASMVEGVNIVDAEKKKRIQFFKYYTLCLCLSMAVIVAVTVPIAMYAFQTDAPMGVPLQSNLPTTKRPTMAPTPHVTTVNEVSAKDKLEDVFGSQGRFHDVGSPQYKAFKWLFEENPPDISAKKFMQRYVLAVLYYSTNGDYWFHCSKGDVVCKDNRKPYLSEGDECGWYGNQCSEDGDITVLFFGTSKGNNLQGTIPGELSYLASLEHIYLINNKLSGTIPSSLSLLPNLETLYLYNNKLEGTFPQDLLDFSTTLKTLVVWGNLLEGTMSTKFGQLVQLENLQLDSNRLTGTIPTEIGQLGYLESLFLGKNQFDGSIPEELFTVTPLEQLFLQYNRLTGTISTNTGNLIHLKEYDITGNSIHGEIPSEFFNAIHFEIAGLGGNDLSGTLSSQFGSLRSLNVFNCSNNGFVGTIPMEIGTLKNLTILQLHGNELTGTMPESICNELGDLKTDLRTLTSDCLVKDDFKVTCKCCTECF